MTKERFVCNRCGINRRSEIRGNRCPMAERAGVCVELRCLFVIYHACEIIFVLFPSVWAVCKKNGFLFNLYVDVHCPITICFLLPSPPQGKGNVDNNHGAISWQRLIGHFYWSNYCCKIVARSIKIYSVLILRGVPKKRDFIKKLGYLINKTRFPGDSFRLFRGAASSEGVWRIVES